jgi:hypothetical protein
LFPRSRGYWAKKVRQKLHDFGKIADDHDGKKAIALGLERRVESTSRGQPAVKRKCAQPLRRRFRPGDDELGRHLR